MHDDFLDYAPLLLASGFEPVPIRPGDKAPLPAGWRRGQIFAERIKQWTDKFPQASVGIRLGHPAGEGRWLIAIDVDSMGEDVSGALRTHLELVLGEVPIRVGMPPKFVALALLAAPQAPPKRATPLYADEHGRDYRLEILGLGQQVVVAGIHPDTQEPYRWEGVADPGDLSIAALPVVTPEILEGLFRSFAQVMENVGAEIVERGHDVEGMGVEDWDLRDDYMDALREGDEGMRLLLVHREPLDDYSLADARADLLVVRCEGKFDRYDSWLAVGMSLHHQFQGTYEAMLLWDEWSAMGDRYRGMPDIEAKWDSFSAEAYRGVPTTVRSLRWFASRERKRRLQLGHNRPVEVVERIPSDRLIESPDLARDEDNRVIKSLTNLAVILERDDALPEIWTNLLSRQCMYGDRPLSNGDYASLRMHLSAAYAIEPSLDKVATALEAVARRNARHPVVSYLEGLTWDGTPRLGTWLTRYLGVEDAPWVREVAVKTLVAAVARAFAPGTKWDSMMVLEGPQGAGKSMAVHALAPDPAWTADMEFTNNDRAMSEIVSSVWVVETGELRGLARGDISQIKAFLSRTKDAFRPAYGRVVEHLDRQCILIGTTNSNDYLRDETGNRRFIPLVTEKVGPLDVAGLVADRDQLWAEATHAYREGLSLRWQGETLEHLQGEQEERLEGEPWEDPIMAHIRTRGIQCVQARNLAADVLLLELSKIDLGVQRRIGAILRRNGWEKRSVPNPTQGPGQPARITAFVPKKSVK
jgi:hypothetical protein